MSCNTGEKPGSGGPWQRGRDALRRCKQPRDWRPPVSNTDSFIEEVTEEVRRDRMFGLMKRYGWIAVLAVLLLVGGTIYSEWSKSKTRAANEAMGDGILAALEREDGAARVAALESVEARTPGAAAVVALLAAGERIDTDPQAAATQLLALADRNDVPLVYRQVATLKAVSIPGAGLAPEDRRERLDGLALGAGLMRLLAEEQLAHLDIEAGQIDAALARLQQISADAESSPGLRQRATELILGLGGEVDAPEAGQ